MSDTMETGQEGENLAAAFLQEKGYTVVERNFRHRHAEIDLIARRDNWLLFIEVKTRSSIRFGQPEQFVDWQKAKNMYAAAEHYIHSINWQGHVRFDVVAVFMGKKMEITHFEDAIN